MSIQAVAILHVHPNKVKAALDPGPEGARRDLEGDHFDVVEGHDGKTYVIESFEDATALHLGIPLGHDDPEVMGTLVAVAVGDIIDDHDEPRGVPLYPDNYRPKARTWEGLLDEIGDALDWAPIEGPEVVDPMGMPGMMPGGMGPGAEDLASMASQMQAMLPPEMLQQAMQMAQQLAGSGSLADVERAMKQMMGPMPGSGEASAGMDFQTIARQAQQMLDANPEMKERLESQLQITDAKISDDDDET